MPENTQSPQRPTPNVTPIVLTARGLSKAFGATEALDCLDLDLRRGANPPARGSGARASDSSSNPDC